MALPEGLGEADLAADAEGGVKQVKITYTPEGVSRVFLRGRFGEASEEYAMEMAELLKAYWLGGYDAAKRGDPRPEMGGPGG